MYSEFPLAPAPGLLVQARQDGGELAIQAQHTFYRIGGPIVPSLFINQFVFFEAPGEPASMRA